jgi:hypothetical protein
MAGVMNRTPSPDWISVNSIVSESDPEVDLIRIFVAEIGDLLLSVVTYPKYL